MRRVSPLVFFCPGIRSVPSTALRGLDGYGRLIGTTTFRANRAGVGGAIFLNVDEGEAPVIVFPEDPADLIFEDNEANVSTMTLSRIYGARSFGKGLASFRELL